MEFVQPKPAGSSRYTEGNKEIQRTHCFVSPQSFRDLLSFLLVTRSTWKEWATPSWENSLSDFNKHPGLRISDLGQMINLDGMFSHIINWLFEWYNKNSIDITFSGMICHNQAIVYVLKTENREKSSPFFHRAYIIVTRVGGRYLENKTIIPTATPGFQLFGISCRCYWNKLLTDLFFLASSSLKEMWTTSLPL